MAKQIFHNDWQARLQDELEKPYYLALRSFLRTEYSKNIIYPPMHDIYNALHFTAFADVKVVILGQDPYHGPGQAHGLSFSVQPGVKQPPSLRNIFKELASDIGCPAPNHGYLKDWAEQGILLLNTTLTVRKGAAASHFNQGWEKFTDQVISSLNQKEQPIVYILWGRHAQSKEKLIDTTKHKIIKSAHPSPLSAHNGFFGSKPFSKANDLLIEAGQPPIDWQVH